MTDKLITHDEARALVNWKKGSKLFDYITQQEQFAKDVARYFELLELQSDEAMFPTEYLFTDNDWKELNYLEEKLSKGVAK